MAPWNARNYTLEAAGDQLIMTQADGTQSELVFYHFHDFRYCIDRSYRLTTEQYRLPRDTVKLAYGAYFNALAEAEAHIKRYNPAAVFHEPPMTLKWITVSLSRRIRFGLRGHCRNYTRKNVLT